MKQVIRFKGENPGENKDFRAEVIELIEPSEDQLKAARRLAKLCRKQLDEQPLELRGD